jgi:hypothetical protein
MSVTELAERQSLPFRRRRLLHGRGMGSAWSRHEHVFFAIELATRRIEIVGITPGPDEAWMMQIGRNLTDPLDGFLTDKKQLIIDRDSK